MTLTAASGRVLARAVVSRVDVPPADNSAMDGYALRLADLQAAHGRLPVSQRIPAGQVPAPLRPGTAARMALYHEKAPELALAGATDTAVEMLQNAFDRGFDDPDMYASDDDLNSLRGDARFQKLLAAVMPQDYREYDDKVGK